MATPLSLPPRRSSEDAVPATGPISLEGSLSGQSLFPDVDPGILDALPPGFGDLLQSIQPTIDQTPPEAKSGQEQFFGTLLAGLAGALSRDPKVGLNIVDEAFAGNQKQQEDARASLEDAIQRRILVAREGLREASANQRTEDTATARAEIEELRQVVRLIRADNETLRAKTGARGAQTAADRETRLGGDESVSKEAVAARRGIVDAAPEAIKPQVGAYSASVVTNGGSPTAEASLQAVTQNTDRLRAADATFNLTVQDLPPETRAGLGAVRATLTGTVEALALNLAGQRDAGVVIPVITIKDAKGKDREISGTEILSLALRAAEAAATKAGVTDEVALRAAVQYVRDALQPLFNEF